ncbi:MAG: NAD(P)H-dependent oxidoreductase [Planctomycetia bacterium]|nr:NAD(P)H-dependent oxidoreductase [Planctomycetia bacterium]
MSTYTPRILALAGSTRRDSFNKRLLRIAVEAARQAGAEVTIIDLKDLALPLFDQDDEAERGLPLGALELKRQMATHQGLLISAPEYNSSITGVLKNAIDWASRVATPDEPALSSFRGKVAAIISASPGALGGLRGLVHLRSILSNINVLVLPEQKSIMKAYEAFEPDGKLKNAQDQQAVERIGAGLAKLLQRLGGGYA